MFDDATMTNGQQKRRCMFKSYRKELHCVKHKCIPLTARGLTYNNNSGQLSIEYLRPDETRQFDKRTAGPTVGQLRRHVASQLHRETATHDRHSMPSIYYAFHDVCRGSIDSAELLLPRYSNANICFDPPMYPLPLPTKLRRALDAMDSERISVYEHMLETELETGRELTVPTLPSPVTMTTPSCLGPHTTPAVHTRPRRRRRRRDDEDESQHSQLHDDD